LIFNLTKFRYIFVSKKRIFFLLVDVLLAVFSYWVAFALRYDGDIPPQAIAFITMMLPFVIILRTPCFIYFGLHGTLWRYLGLQELFSIIKAVTAGSVFLLLVSFFSGVRFHPRSVFVMDWLMLIMALSGLRIFFRIAVEKLNKPPRVSTKKVLIIGAEDAGELLVREFLKQPNLGYRPVGFLDNDPKKLGICIHGVLVMGNISRLSHTARVSKAEEIIIALPKASSDEIREVVKCCRDLHLNCRIIPKTSFLFPPQVLPLKLRPINISDLLGRELLQVDLASVDSFFRDKCILVTGAGGSIGSELVKIIFQSHPRELVLIDNSENNLHEISMDLAKSPFETEISFYLADITDREALKKIFVRHEPDVVYHAAAYKHVPLMETHFREGILNNVLGTKTVADLALQYGAARFVLISTDKAIRPQSIMGATKRIAELYIQSLKGGTARFLTVRFGNVFNSKGSVVSLFQKQIAEGSSITIAHPAVKRYFMDVSEAVFLILEATMLGSDSEVFVLDMGKPIKIIDLARDLAQLMGASLENLPINYIGLRPGDKLEEDLELSGEEAISTPHKKIRIWKSKNNFSGNIQQEVDALIELALAGASREAVIQKLKQVVPEYTPWHSSDETLTINLPKVLFDTKA